VHTFTVHRQSNETMKRGRSATDMNTAQFRQDCVTSPATIWSNLLLAVLP